MCESVKDTKCEYLLINLIPIFSNMNPPIKSSDWVLCPSKTFPGKLYYFNVTTGETVWFFNESEKPGLKTPLQNDDHGYPEPSSPPVQVSSPKHPSTPGNGNSNSSQKSYDAGPTFHINNRPGVCQSPSSSSFQNISESVKMSLPVKTIQNNISPNSMAVSLIVHPFDYGQMAMPCQFQFPMGFGNSHMPLIMTLFNPNMCNQFVQQPKIIKEKTNEKILVHASNKPFSERFKNCQEPTLKDKDNKITGENGINSDNNCLATEIGQKLDNMPSMRPKTPIFTCDKSLAKDLKFKPKMPTNTIKPIPNMDNWQSGNFNTNDTSTKESVPSKILQNKPSFVFGAKNWPNSKEPMSKYKIPKINDGNKRFLSQKETNTNSFERHNNNNLFDSSTNIEKQIPNSHNTFQTSNGFSCLDSENSEMFSARTQNKNGFESNNKQNFFSVAPNGEKSFEQTQNKNNGFEYTDNGKSILGEIQIDHNRNSGFTQAQHKQNFCGLNQNKELFDQTINKKSHFGQTQNSQFVQTHNKHNCHDIITQNKDKTVGQDQNKHNGYDHQLDKQNGIKETQNEQSHNKPQNEQDHFNANGKQQNCNNKNITDQNQRQERFFCQNLTDYCQTNIWGQSQSNEMFYQRMEFSRNRSLFDITLGYEERKLTMTKPDQNEDKLTTQFANLHPDYELAAYKKRTENKSLAQNSKNKIPSKHETKNYDIAKQNSSLAQEENKEQENEFLNLDESDLRHLIIAKKKRKFVDAPSDLVPEKVESKKIKTTRQENTKVQEPKKKVSFNPVVETFNDVLSFQSNEEDYDYVTESTIEENKQCFVVADTISLLEHYETIDNFVKSNFNFTLFLPYCIISDVVSISRNERSESQLVKKSRDFLRKLATPQSKITVQEETQDISQNSSVEAILNSCLQLLADSRVILITNDENLQREAKRFQIKYLTTDQVIVSQDLSKLKFDFKKIKVFVTNDLNVEASKHDDYNRRSHGLDEENLLNSSVLTALHQSKDSHKLTEPKSSYFDNALKKYSVNTLKDIASLVKRNNQNQDNKPALTKDSILEINASKSKEAIIKKVCKTIYDYDHYEGETKFKKQYSNFEAKNKEQLNSTQVSIFDDNNNQQENFDNEALDLENNLEGFLRNFSIKNSDLKNALPNNTRVEIVCSFRQLLEEYLPELLKDKMTLILKNLSITLPLSIETSLKCINFVYGHQRAVKNVVNALASVLNAKGEIPYSDILKGLGCAFALLKSLEPVLESKEALKDMELSLKFILEHARAKPDDVLEKAIPGLCTNSLSEICESDDVPRKNKRNFRKDRSEILLYLKKHYPAWVNYDDTSDSLHWAKDYKDALIVRTCGKHLNKLTLNGTEPMTIIESDSSISKDVFYKEPLTIINKENIYSNSIINGDNSKNSERHSTEPKIVRLFGNTNFNKVQNETKKYPKLDLESLDTRGHSFGSIDQNGPKILRNIKPIKELEEKLQRHLNSNESCVDKIDDMKKPDAQIKDPIVTGNCSNAINDLLDISDTTDDENCAMSLDNCVDSTKNVYNNENLNDNPNNVVTSTPKKKNATQDLDYDSFGTSDFDEFFGITDDLEMPNSNNSKKTRNEKRDRFGERQKNDIYNGTKDVGQMNDIFGQNDDLFGQKDDTTSDSGFENSRQHSYILLDTFFSEMKVSFKFVQRFMENSIRLLRSGDLQETQRKFVQETAISAQKYLDKFLDRFDRIIYREAIIGPKVKDLLHGYSVAEDDIRIKNYKQLVIKCHDQAAILDDALKMLLKLTKVTKKT